MPSKPNLLHHLARRALLLAAVLACALASPARAHTRVDHTVPGDGDTARTAVTELRLRFSRPVEGELTSITLLRGGVQVARGGRAVPETEAREYVLQLPAALQPGAYVARWRTVGGDGHVLEGEWSFTVEAPAPPVAAAPLSPPASALAPPPGPPQDEAAEHGEEVGGAEGPLAVAVRWAWFAALLAAIGVVAFRFGVLPRLAKDPAHREVATRAEAAAWFVALGAAALSMATLLGRLWMQAAALGGGDAWNGDRLDLLLTRTGWGLAWVLQAIATVAFVMGLLVARAPYGRGAGWMGAGAGAVLLSAVPALSGHAASVTRLPGVAILSDTLHVLGAGVWLGTLLAILAVGLPAALSVQAQAGPAVRAMVASFSPMALVAAAAVGVTGVVNAVFQITAPADLWSSGYGRALLLKVVLLAGVAAIGWYNWKVVLPGLGDETGAQRLRKSARAELGLGAAVLLITAVLVALPTP